jgi:hypothetical protein
VASIRGIELVVIDEGGIKRLTSSLPGPRTLSSRSDRSEDSCTELDTAMPASIPNADARYKPPAEVAMSFWATDAVRAINVEEPAKPLPKPPGMISRLSHMEISPCQRRISRMYVMQEQMVARIVRVLYRAVRRIR